MTGASRILVIDDDRILRETLHEVLVDEGYEVRAASNGHEAIGLLDDWVANLVILDLMMPLMDAFAFRASQQGAGHSSAAPLLILSAAPGLEEAGTRLGAAATLGKPFGLDALLATVERLLRP
jgi:DNA-binding response OmpR family regulator